MLMGTGFYLYIKRINEEDEITRQHLMSQVGTCFILGSSIAGSIKGPIA